MRVVRTRGELEAALAGCDRPLGFVPTMGNLHRGHLKLVESAKANAQSVVASIFVNPLQFGPSEDFASYPRSFDADCEALENAGVDVLFAPTVEEMYPDGPEAVPGISVPFELAGDLDGRSRPGHFDGVATVVHQLLAMVQPDVAVFGEKDFQQLLVIRWLVREFQLPVTVLGEPTVREPDGLAMSSRNQYLNAEERQQAATIYQVLRECVAAIRAGNTDFVGLAEAGSERLESAGFIPDYVAIRNADDLSAPESGQPLVVLVAARLGKARLIDNLRA